MEGGRKGKLMHVRLQLSESTPDGHTTPWVFKAARQTTSLVRDSKRTGCGCSGGSSEMMAECEAFCAGGCFSFSISRTVLPSIFSFRFSAPPPSPPPAAGVLSVTFHS